MLQEQTSVKREHVPVDCPTLVYQKAGTVCHRFGLHFPHTVLHFCHTVSPAVIRLLPRRPGSSLLSSENPQDPPSPAGQL